MVDVVVKKELVQEGVVGIGYGNGVVGFFDWWPRQLPVGLQCHSNKIESLCYQYASGSVKW